jgi:hypothetical protein
MKTFGRIRVKEKSPESRKVVPDAGGEWNWGGREEVERGDETSIRGGRERARVSVNGCVLVVVKPVYLDTGEEIESVC